MHTISSVLNSVLVIWNGHADALAMDMGDEGWLSQGYVSRL